jgi:hypothetical protein
VRKRDLAVAAAISFCSCALAAQSSTSGPETGVTNSVGIEFVLVQPGTMQPGTMQVGVFHPSCPDPNDPALRFDRLRRREPLIPQRQD